MSRPSRGAHDLPDKALGSRRASSSIADAARANSQIVGRELHDGKTAVSQKKMAVDALISLAIWFEAPADIPSYDLKTATQPTTCPRRTSALLSCNPWLISPCPHSLASRHAIPRDTLRRSADPIMAICSGVQTDCPTAARARIDRQWHERAASGFDACRPAI